MSESFSLNDPFIKPKCFALKPKIVWSYVFKNVDMRLIKMEIPVMSTFVEGKRNLHEYNMIAANFQSVCPSSDQQSWEQSQSQFKGHWVRNQSEIATGTWQMVVKIAIRHLVPDTWHLVLDQTSSICEYWILCSSLHFTSNLLAHKLMPSHTARNMGGGS